MFYRHYSSTKTPSVARGKTTEKSRRVEKALQYKTQGDGDKAGRLKAYYFGRGRGIITIETIGPGLSPHC